jgi:hypothetical protein
MNKEILRDVSLDFARLRRIDFAQAGTANLCV